MPGVLSARWSGRHGDDEANLRLVLDQLADVPDDRLGAAFVCAAALATPSGGRGRRRGADARPAGPRAAGAQRLRLRPDLRRRTGQTLTNAELPPAEKDAISHRGKALRAIAPHIVRATESLSR